MKTISIPTTYNLIWQFKHDNKYQISECLKIINVKTGKVIKENLNGYSKGYWIGRKFIRKSEVNNFVEKIKNIEIPF